MTMTDRGELERLRAENARLKMIIDDYRSDIAKVLNDRCPTDEKHCGCVTDAVKNGAITIERSPEEIRIALEILLRRDVDGCTITAR